MITPSGLLDLAGGLYADLMMDATYGGFPFNIINTTTDDGRRIQRVLFPGQDRRAFFDGGQLDGEITFTGLLIGDDAVHQAERLRAVFQKPGVQTLDIPFFDVAIQVVPVKPLQITQSTEELRVARFTATVERWLPREAATADTLQGILDAISDLQVQVRGWLRTVLKPLGLALSVISYARRVANLAAGYWDVATSLVSSASVATAASGPIANLRSVNTVPPDAAYADAIADRLAAPSAAIVATSIVTIPAAVAPGGDTTTPIAVDGRITAGVILTVAQQLAPADAAAPGAAVAVAAMALAIADAVAAASDIPFESQQEALSWQTRLTVAIDQAAALAAVFAAADPINGGPVWRALLALRDALSADMTATIGRLPVVQTFTSPSVLSAWILAQHLSGDRPDRLLAVYRDLVSRNRIVNPALVPVGRLEVLP